METKTNSWSARQNHGKPGAVCGKGICDPGENERKCPADCSGVELEEPWKTETLPE